ncbi:hypothetical protein C0R09_14815 [Brevibacillus laterosporus]|uniref:hypothetical protein n=1 Tax=Brevibacillus laterosporus TaxID=1465 RepID=UPI000C786D9F|nr:hypothetical protein [Brevibacillus laterosporus]AUM65689.1 hypothetical protein C0R09_14815 [Brevibacillus laterosporus]
MNGSEKNILPKGGGERGTNIQLSKERNRIAPTPALFDNAKRGKEYRKYGKSMTNAKKILLLGRLHMQKAGIHSAKV